MSNRYVNEKICSECEGECCITCGCHFSPEDFKSLTYEGLIEELDKGYISIDRKGEDGYYLRVRNTMGKVCDIREGYTGRCALLRNKSCVLKYEKRPKGARKLIPYYPDECDQQYEITQCIEDWKPYSEILERLYKFYYEKDIKNSLIN